MAYYHTEDLNEQEPPPPPVEDAPAGMAKEDVPAWKKLAEARHKTLLDERKVRVAKQEARGTEASRFLYAVVHSATNKIVCSCEGPAQANYIAGLMNDRPHM